MGDPEIEAMSSVANALSDLDESAQGRVLRWAAERYGVTLDKEDVHRGLAGGGRAASGGTDPAVTEQEVAAEVAAFEHFAELYDAAGPKDKEEELLVAAYWRQRTLGQSSFQASELNRDLKDLGHQVDHISEALAASIKKRPASVLQLRKSGSSQQARKTYKLSGEGMKVVELMLRNDR